MNKNATFFLLSALSFLLFLQPRNTTAQPAKQFEGTFTYTITIPQMGDEKMPMTTNIKGDKVEIETDMGAMGGMHMYMDRVKRTMIMVMDNMKMGYTMDLPKETPADTSMTDGIKPTGKSDVVNGFKSEEFIGNTKDGTITVWASADFPEDVRSAMIQWMKNNPQTSGGKMFAVLMQKGLAPVRVISTKGAEVAATIDFVKFEQKSLPDALFVPATDIKLSPMPAGAMGGH